MAQKIFLLYQWIDTREDLWLQRSIWWTSHLERLYGVIKYISEVFCILEALQLSYCDRPYLHAFFDLIKGDKEYWWVAFDLSLEGWIKWRCDVGRTPQTME